MKKFLNSTLSIIIIFVAIFVLTPSLSLAQAIGYCTFPAGGTASGYTKEQCAAANGTWTQTSGATSTSTCTVEGLGNIICKVHQLLNSIIPVLIALGVVYFVWGVVQYVIGDSDEAKSKGKDRIIYGIIGLAVISGLWGLVNIVVNTFGLEGTSAPTLVPLTGTSATCSLEGSPKFQDLLCYLTRIINDSIIPLIFALATAFFIWGAVKFFIINSDEEAQREQGKQFMIWGIIALAVMLSVWGLVGIVGGTFGINTSVLPQVKP